MKVLDYTGTSHLVSKTKTELAKKVDKVTGKGLSTNDYTNAEKQKVADSLTDAPSDGKQYARQDGDWEELDLDGKANIDGYYDTLSVGLADNLIDRKGNGTPQEISYRTSCGDDSIADDGNGIIQSIFGKTVVWNQLFKTLNSTNWRAEGGVTVSEWGDNSATYTTSTANNGIASTSNPTLSVGHKYLVRALVKANGACRVTFGYQSNSNVYTYANFTSETTSYAEYSEIRTCTSSARTDAYAYSNTTGVEVSVKNLMLFDLTQLFGSGNEPTTVDDPRIEWIKQYATAHPEYNSGELISYNGSGIKTVGFNQWDEEWELGTFNTTTGANTASSSQIRSKNPIPILPNTTYYFKTANNYAWVIFLDADKNVIEGYYASTSHDGNSSTLSDRTFVTPPNGAYMKFYMLATYGATYKNDICLNFSWSGYRNGEYEPYWSRTLNLPISTYFPDGMKSAGSVRDELTKDKAVKRIHKLRMSELDWRWFTDAGGYFAVPADSMPIAAKPAVSANIAANIICNNYIPRGTAYIYTSQYIDMSVGIHTNGVVILQNVACRGNVGALKTALSDSYLFYELATPTETTITPPLDLTYKVADFGTEESIAEGKSTPFNGIIKYSDDFTRGLVNMPKNYDTTASLDALATSLSTMLTSALDGTVTITRGAYDSTNKKYAWNCSYTPNA